MFFCLPTRRFPPIFLFPVIPQPDETDDVLNNLLVPKNRRAMLKCKTKALDMISTDCIGTGARLPEGNDWLKVDRVGPGGVVKRE